MRLEIPVFRNRKTMIGALLVETPEISEVINIDVDVVKAEMGLGSDTTLMSHFQDLVDEFESKHQLPVEQAILGWEFFIALCLEKAIIDSADDVDILSRYYNVDLVVDPESKIRVTLVTNNEYTSIVLPLNVEDNLLLN